MIVRNERRRSPVSRVILVTFLMIHDGVDPIRDMYAPPGMSVQLDSTEGVDVDCTRTAIPGVTSGWVALNFQTFPSW